MNSRWGIGTSACARRLYLRLRLVGDTLVCLLELWASAVSSVIKLLPAVSVRRTFADTAATKN